MGNLCELWNINKYKYTFLENQQISHTFSCTEAVKFVLANTKYSDTVVRTKTFETRIKSRILCLGSLYFVKN